MFACEKDGVYPYVLHVLPLLIYFHAPPIAYNNTYYCTSNKFRNLLVLLFCFVIDNFRNYDQVK